MIFIQIYITIIIGLHLQKSFKRKQMHIYFHLSRPIIFCWTVLWLEPTEFTTKNEKLPKTFAVIRIGSSPTSNTKNNLKVLMGISQ